MQGIRKALVDPDMKASVEKQHRQEINFFGVMECSVFGKLDAVYLV